MASLSALEAKKEALLRKLAEKKQQRLQQEQQQQQQKQQQDRSVQLPSSAAPPLRVDALGREVGADGRVVGVRGPVATTAVNQRAQTARLLASGRRALEEESRAAVQSAYWDPRVARRAERPARRPRGLVFAAPGTYVQEAAQRRADAAAAQSAAAATAAAAAAELAALTVPAADPVPAGVEWWDAPLVAGAEYPADAAGVRLDVLDARVERPPLLEPALGSGNGSNTAVPVMLTREERKRIRRRRRQEKLRVRAEAVMAGLAAPPPPKVRLSNMMRVLTAEAVQDPTEIERRVREEAEARKQYRERLNNARRVGRRRRREQREARLLRDAAEHGYGCAVYRLARGTLDDPAKRFKVHRNAQTWLLTGCALRCPPDMPCQLVVVEGCPRAMAKYKTLMLHRIKWSRAPLTPIPEATTSTAAAGGSAQAKEESGGDNKETKMEDSNEGKEDEEDDEDDEDEDDEEENEEKDRKLCQLLWEGAIEAPTFKAFTIEGPEQHAGSELSVRKFLHQHSVEHLWDLAVKS